MPSYNPPNFTELQKKLDPYYRYHIWKASDPNGCQQKVSKFNEFYNDAFHNFIPGSGFSCAILCDSTADYTFSHTVYAKLLFELVDAHNDTMRPKALMADDVAKTEFGSINTACDNFLNADIMHEDTEVIFHIASNCVFCHVAPNINNCDDLLSNFRNTVRFGLILPFLYNSVKNATTRSEYNRIADILGKEFWTDVEFNTVIQDIHRITSNIRQDFPQKWCLLISLPHSNFNSMLRSVQAGAHPYVDRIIQIEKHGDALIAALADAIANRDKALNMIVPFANISTKDTELLTIHSELLKEFKENKSNLLEN